MHGAQCTDWPQDLPHWSHNGASTSKDVRFYGHVPPPYAVAANTDLSRLSLSRRHRLPGAVDAGLSDAVAAMKPPRQRNIRQISTKEPVPHLWTASSHSTSASQWLLHQRHWGRWASEVALEYPPARVPPVPRDDQGPKMAPSGPL